MHVKLWSLNAFWQMWNWEGKVKDELKPKRLAYSYPDAWPQRHWRTAINILFEVIKLHGFSYLARLEGGLSRSIINNLHVKLGLPPLHFGKCRGGSKMNQSPCGEFPLKQSKQWVDAWSLAHLGTATNILRYALSISDPKRWKSTKNRIPFWKGEKVPIFYHKYLFKWKMWLFWVWGQKTGRAGPITLKLSTKRNQAF